MYLLQPGGNIGVNWDTSSYGMIYTTNNKFKFRSPFRTDDYHIAYYVSPNGNVNDDLDVGWGDSVENSYGNTLRRNPVI